MQNPNIQGTGAKIAVVMAMLFLILTVGVMAFGEWTGMFSMFPVMGAIGGGATTLSLDKAQFTDSSSIFSGNVWILHITPGGQSQDFVGRTVTETITPDEMNNAGAGVSPESNLRIGLNVLSQHCVYPIQEDDENPPGYDDPRYDNHVYFNKQDRWNTIGLCAPGEIDDKCGNKPYCTGGSVCWRTWLGTQDCDCWAFWLEPLTVAVDVNIAAIPKIRTITQFSIEKDGILKTRVFDTDRENGRADEGFLPEGTNDLAYVTWTGYNTIGSCTYADAEHGSIYDIGSYYAFKRGDSGQWHLSEKSKYNNYKNIKSSILTSFNTRYGLKVSESVYDDIEDEMDTIAQATSLAVANKGYLFGGVQSDDKGTYDAMIIQPLKSLAYLPNYVLYIKADWLKIDAHTNVEPRITNVEFVKQGDETQVGKVIVTGKNDGNDNGELVFSIDCEYPFEKLTDVQRRYVIAGKEETVTFSIGLSTGITKEICRYCTVEVANKWDIREPELVEVCTSPNEWCTPTQKYCGLGSDSNSIVTCNSYGTGYLDSPKTDCGTGTCTYRNGGTEPYCREPVTCLVDSDCDDGNPNTRDRCIDTFLGKKCENTPVDTCMSDDDCNDDTVWTVDSCKRTFIQKQLGQPGFCNRFDILPIVAILLTLIALVAMGLFIALILGIAVMLKRKQPGAIVDKVVKRR